MATPDLSKFGPLMTQVGNTLHLWNQVESGMGILFMAASNGTHGYDYDIYRVDVDTGSLERFTTGNEYATALRVSADGRTAVFLKWRTDGHKRPVESDVYLLDLGTRNLKQLTISGLN